MVYNLICKVKKKKKKTIYLNKCISECLMLPPVYQPPASLDADVDLPCIEFLKWLERLIYTQTMLTVDCRKAEKAAKSCCDLPHFAVGSQNVSILNAILHVPLGIVPHTYKFTSSQALTCKNIVLSCILYCTFPDM